jgi:hypothetical protein
MKARHCHEQHAKIDIAVFCQCSFHVQVKSVGIVSVQPNVINEIQVGKDGRMSSGSKHNCLYVVIFIIMLKTCFGPYAGPSSRHKMYKEEKLYSVSRKV